MTQSNPPRTDHPEHSLRTDSSSWLKATYLERALPLALVALLLELIWLPFTYVSGFVSLPGDWALLMLQALALAPVTATFLTLVVAVAQVLVRRVPGRWASATAWTVVTGYVVMACGLVGNGPGRPLGLGPWWAYGLVAVTAALLWWAVRPSRLSEQGRKQLAAGLLAASVIVAWVFVYHLADFYFGRFGFGSAKHGLWTTVLLAVIWASLMVPAGLVWLSGRARGGSLSAPRRTSLSIGLFVLAAAAFGCSGYFYVDDYLELHTWLHLLAWTAAWHGLGVLSEGFVHRPGRGGLWTARVVARLPGWARSALSWVLLTWVGSAVSLAAIGIRSNSGYVGSVHTVLQRQALELIYGDIPSLWSWPTDRVRFLRNRYARLRNRPLPVISHGRLPSTFAPLDHHPGLARPGLGGVVIFFLDRKRPKDLGPYGNPSKTPRISQCFRGAFRFDSCLSAGVSTEISFPAIYTSTYAATRWQRRETNLHRPYWFAYQKGYNLPRVFARAGFSTAVVTNRWYYDVFFHSPLKAALFSGFARIVRDDPTIADQTESLAVAYGATGGLVPTKGRYLLVFHIQAHALSALPGIDAFVGKVCDEIRAKGRWKDTVILLTADHGVQFREHGRTSYGHTLFEEEAKVPLLVRIPGLSGRPISHPVSSLDMLPTLVDLFGLEEYFRVEGRSYLPLLAASSRPRPNEGTAVQGSGSDFAEWRSAWNERYLFAETRTRYRSAAVRQGRFKLIWWAKTGAIALFDLERDPRERHNLADQGTFRAVRHRLWSALRKFLSERGELTWPW